MVRRPIRRGGLAVRGALTVLVVVCGAAGAAAQAPSPVASAADESFRVGGEARVRLEGHTTSHEEDDFEWQALTAPERRLWRRRVRVWGELDLLPQATLHLELQHAAVWSSDGLAFPSLDRTDLRQAYVEVRPSAWRGVAFRAGRFAVPTVGDGRLLSEDDFTDMGRVLDGVAARWERGGVRVTALAANVSETDPLPDPPGEGPDHWLAAAIIEARSAGWLELDWVHVERWFPREFASEDPADHRTGPRIDATVGGRAAVRWGPVRISAEAYAQAGVVGPDLLRAAATAERAEWRVWDVTLAPTVFFEHAFASGDRRPTDGVRETFDPIFPDSHAHLGPYDALGWRNVNALAAGGTVCLAPLARALADWRLTFVARGSFLHRRADAWYGADGRPRLVDPTGSGASSHTLEGELSGYLEGTLADGRVAVSFGLAHWCPNNWLTDLGFHDHGYRVWAQTSVRF